jgi:carbonic anhydrase
LGGLVAKTNTRTEPARQVSWVASHIPMNHYSAQRIPSGHSGASPYHMSSIELLLQNNRAWSENMTSGKPDYFRQLAKQQAPKFLWIGCADSRVPANEVVGLLPGELFVHRNVANLVYPSDLNCLSVVQFAVAVLKVEHIIVCGHYGCGGVKAAMSTQHHGLIDSWLSKIKDLYVRNYKSLDSVADQETRSDRLCELNVVEQVEALSRTAIVQDAWYSGQNLAIHGWIYGLKDGLINELGVRVDRLDQVPFQYRFERNG